MQQNKVLEEESTLTQWGRLLQSRQLRGINIAVLFTGFSQGAGPCTGVIFATEHLGMSVAQLGGMYSICVLAMAAVVKPVVVVVVFSSFGGGVDI